MADAEFRARVTVTGAEEAAQQLEQIAAAGEGLDGDEIKTTVDADTEDAQGELDQVGEQVDELDGATATATAEVDADTEALADVTAGLDEVDGSTATATAEVDADTEALGEVTAGLEEVDGATATATATVEVEGTEALDEAAAAVENLDGASATISVDTGAATEGVGQFTDALSGPAGLSGAIGGLATKAGPVGAAIAGLGLVAFESMNKFMALAEQVRVLSERTGVSEEDFSRWAAVADDANIDAETLAGGLGQIVKNLDSAAWAQYGIDVHGAGGEIRSTDDLLLEALDILGRIEDPTARAAAGIELLGNRGFRALAPMIGATREEYETWLAAVSDGQVITAEEVAKAEEMRQAQDALSESFEEVQLALGELMVELAPVVQGLADLHSKLMPILYPVIGLSRGVDALGGALQSGADALNVFGSEGDGFNRLLEESNENIRRLTGNLTTGADVIDTMAEASAAAAWEVRQFGDAQAAAQETLDSATAAMAASAEAYAALEEELAAGLRDTTAAFEESAAAATERANAFRAAADANFAFTDAEAAMAEAIAGFDQAMLDAEGDVLAQRQIMQDFATTAASVSDAQVRIAEETARARGETLTAAQANSIWNSTMLERARNVSGPARQSILDYVAAVNGIPADKQTEIAALIEAGNLAEAQRLIDEVSAARDLHLTAQVDTANAQAGTDALQDYADGNPLVVPTFADTAPAEDDVEEFTDGDFEAIIQTGAFVEPASGAIAEVEDATYQATIGTTAETATSADAMLDLISQTRVAVINLALLNRELVRGQIDGLTDPRSVPINAYLRDWPTSDEIIRTIGPVRVPLDLYVRSEPRITGER